MLWCGWATLCDLWETSAHLRTSIDGNYKAKSKGDKMIYRCPACKQFLKRDGRKGKFVKSYCDLNQKTVNLRKVTKKAKVK